MGVPERRARHKQALRQQILEAAREVFVKEGYESVSMRKIAEKIEYSPTTIYLYFRDKSDLLRCLCDETFARLSRTVDRIEKEGGDPLQRLIKGLRAYIDFGLRNPNDYRVAFMLESSALIASQARDEHTMAFRAYSQLRRHVEECVATQKFRQQDVEAASQVLWSAIHGITSLLIVHPDFPWIGRTALINLLVDTLLRGMEA
jgi:AcrR family transcriptional regulator